MSETRASRIRRTTPEMETSRIVYDIDKQKVQGRSIHMTASRLSCQDRERVQGNAARSSQLVDRISCA